jgi:hypothetical protein
MAMKVALLIMIALQVVILALLAGQARIPVRIPTNDLLLEQRQCPDTRNV